MAEQESQPQETASAGGEEGSGAGGGGQEPKTPGLWSAAGTRKTGETESALTGLVPVLLQPPEQGDASRAFSVGIARGRASPPAPLCSERGRLHPSGQWAPSLAEPTPAVVLQGTSGRKVPGLAFDPVDTGFWYPESLPSEPLPRAQNSTQLPPCSGRALKQAPVPCSGVSLGELCPQTLVLALGTSRPLVLRNTPYPPSNCPLSVREFPFGHALWPWPSHSCDESLRAGWVGPPHRLGDRDGKMVPGRSVFMTRGSALSRAAAVPTRRGSPGVKIWDREGEGNPGSRRLGRTERAGVGCVQRSRKDGEAAEKKERVTAVLGGDRAGSGRQIEEKKGGWEGGEYWGARQC